MKKEKLIKAMNTVTMLCTAAEAVLLVRDIARRHEEKKQEEARKPKDVYLRVDKNLTKEELVDAFMSACGSIWERPSRIWLSDDVDSYMLVSFEARASIYDSDRVMPVISVFTFTDGVPVMWHDIPVVLHNGAVTPNIIGDLAATVLYLAGYPSKDKKEEKE